MSAPTSTLTVLRRRICQELRMPFFRRYSNGFLDADSGSTTTLVDTDLVQEDGFWTRSWIYRVASQQHSMIVKFDAKTDTCYLDVPVTTFSAGDDYEIQSMWNAFEIREALNEAIREVQRIYPDPVMDETLIVQEDVMKYDLTTLAKTPFLLHKIWLEQPASIHRGQAVSATSTTLVVENSGILSGVTSSWKVSIYDGTGKGQIRSVSSVVAATITVTSWTTTPDSTSKYALWDASEEHHDWTPYNYVRSDTKQFPNLLYFTNRQPAFYGLRIRIQYTALPQTLSAEADTSIVPQGYLVPAAISILHGQFIGDNRADRELHFGEARRYREMALSYLAQNTPARPDSAVQEESASIFTPDSANPLNWGI